ncbi:MAG: GAF domain-containing protein [Actinobacteria bacterium]|nr:GAF domain-containing protein [Actinomycetota bacterium]
MCDLNTRTPPIPAASDAQVDERRVLYEIIRTVSSSVDLEQVLGAITELVTEQTRAHATLIFIAEGPDEDLVLQSVSDDTYRDQIGSVRMKRGEGLAGWVAKHREPVFIAENALQDPRVKYFPEFEEEKYQSIVSVPLIAPDSELIGVIALHAEAPRVFTEEDAAFVIHSASLVASAIVNARLYEAARRRVRELEGLSALSNIVSTATALDDLLPVAVARALPLLQAESAHIYLLDRGDRLQRHASAPEVGDAPSAVTVSELAESRRTGSTSTVQATLGAALWGASAEPGALLVPMLADGEVLGALVVHTAAGRRFSPDDRDLAASIASQIAVGIKKIRLIEGLEERNLIKDFFADLAAGRFADGLSSRARRLGCDFAQPKLALVAIGWRDANDEERATALERFRANLVRAMPGVLMDQRDEEAVALVPALGTDESDSLRRLEKALGEGANRLPLVIGVSSPCLGAAALATGLQEARQAALAAPVIVDAPAVVPYDGLGPYKYLLRVPLDGDVRDRQRDALRKLGEYDRQRQAQLTRTLEEFLRQRGNISATAQALYVHPNTLRQRLRRIEALTGISIKGDDWLMIEIALKLIRLEEALGRQA